MEYQPLEISSNIKLENSIENLLSHCKNKQKFKKLPFLISSGGKDIADYTGKSIKRSKFTQKHFYEKKFVNSAAAESYFFKCNFEYCDWINANFQECIFLQSTIQKNGKQNPINSCNFDKSLFSDNFLITNSFCQNSVFRQTAFIDGTIQDTTFFSSTFTEATFSNMLLNSVFFNDLNIDYSTFDNVKMNNVILPFSQICFTYGLLSYLMNTKDDVYITSIKNEHGYITSKEFIELLPDFEIYYKETNDFFPLANIFLSLGEYENAKKTILNGILQATTICDFRQIKHLSKLIYTYSVFDFHERKHIYDYINSHVEFFNMNPSLLYNYNTYKNEICSLLLANNRTGTVTSEINIITDINFDEAEKIGIILTTLELVIEQGKSPNGEHEILCRHNSAEEIFIKIQDIYQALEMIIPTIYVVLLSASTLRGTWITQRKNKIELKHAAELKEIELKKARIELEREELALKKEKEALAIEQNEKLSISNKIQEEILRENIAHNNIVVKEIQHITYGDIPLGAEREILQFSLKNRLNC